MEEKPPSQAKFGELADVACLCGPTLIFSKDGADWFGCTVTLLERYKVVIELTH